MRPPRCYIDRRGRNERRRAVELVKAFLYFARHIAHAKFLLSRLLGHTTDRVLADTASALDD